MERVILHVDMNAFYASVETLYHPEAVGRPMAVCGDAESRRGVILAKNELAKKRGVKTAETVWQAQQKCPGLLLLSPHHERYSEYSARANQIYRRYTDQVEPVSIDESFLDVTGSQMLFGTGEEIANNIRAVVQKELGLTVSVGVSFCKTFAKLGSDYKKPNATTVITRENYRELLYPLPVTDFFSVGAATAKLLYGLGVTTVGGLASLPEDLLRRRLGKHGTALFRAVQGLEQEPVRRLDEAEEIKSIGNSLTFKRDLITESDIHAGLMPLAEKVGERLRAHGLKCGGVQVAIKNPAFQTIERQMQFPQPTYLTSRLFEGALELVRRAWKIGSPIRLLSVTAINLMDEQDNQQLSLFAASADNRKQEALDRSLDAIKQKYGKSIVKRALILENDLGIKE